MRFEYPELTIYYDIPPLNSHPINVNTGVFVSLV